MKKLMVMLLVLFSVYGCGVTAKGTGSSSSSAQIVAPIVGSYRLISYDKNGVSQNYAILHYNSQDIEIANEWYSTKNILSDKAYSDQDSFDRVIKWYYEDKNGVISDEETCTYFKATNTIIHSVWNNGETISTCNANGQLINSICYKPLGTVDGYWEYQTSGNITIVNYYDDANKTTLSETTVYTYDNLGRCILEDSGTNGYIVTTYFGNSKIPSSHTTYSGVYPTGVINCYNLIEKI